MKAKTEFKVRVLLLAVLTIVLILLLTSKSEAAERPGPLDPNLVPFGVEPNQCSGELLTYAVAEANSVTDRIIAHNKGGWLTDLSIQMCDGTPTDHTVVRVTPTPAHDPNGGWNQVFEWQWTPPGEGIFYLEFRLSSRGRPDWKTDVRSIVVYSYADDSPFLYSKDAPYLVTMEEKARTWQAIQKLREQPSAIGAGIRALGAALPGVLEYAMQWTTSDDGVLWYRGPVAMRVR